MLRRVFGQPLEQMLALGSFCGGGVLARHPKLRVAYLEANCSWLPWLLWRLDEGWEREGDVWAPDLKMAPSEYFKRQCVVSVEPDEATVKQVIEYMGGKHVVFSTDYPHGDSSSQGGQSFSQTSSPPRKAQHLGTIALVLRDVTRKRAASGSPPPAHQETGQDQV